MIANIIIILITADQKPGLASMIQGGGQICSLLAIYILTYTTEGSLFNLALYYSGVPCIFLFIISFLVFRFSSYRKYSPSYTFFNKKLIFKILTLGGKFFIIYLCIIVIFQMVNVIIMREVGSLAVTKYNISNRYFNVIYILTIIIITPIWSAFTDAHTKKDTIWMKNVMNKLEKCWLLLIALSIIMIVFSDFIYKSWIGEDIEIPFTLSLAMAVFILVQCIGSIYMNMINGIGKITLQAIIYVIIACLSWPVYTWSCRNWGVVGVLLVPTAAYTIQAVFGRIQLQKLLQGDANGLWNK
jgi:O-antigen/teichoic acid export membrane protein